MHHKVVLSASLMTLALASCSAASATRDNEVQITPANGRPSVTGGADSVQEASRWPTPRRDRNRLTRDEIAGVRAGNLYEVVQRLRPGWLRARSSGSLQGPGAEVLAVHGTTILGSAQALRSIPTENVLGMEYMDAAQAVASLPGIGSRRVAGAIVILDRRSR